jgi:hypothetical protein
VQENKFTIENIRRRNVDADGSLAVAASILRTRRSSFEAGVRTSRLDSTNHEMLVSEETLPWLVVNELSPTRKPSVHPTHGARISGFRRRW